MDIELQNLFGQLASLGMDPEELEFWKGIAPALTDSEKAQLALNLKSQIAALGS